MRVVTIALLLVAIGCGGKARHVVIHPDEVPGRRGDGWRITSEPASAHRSAEGAPPVQ